MHAIYVNTTGNMIRCMARSSTHSRARSSCYNHHHHHRRQQQQPPQQQQRQFQPCSYRPILPRSYPSPTRHGTIHPPSLRLRLRIDDKCPYYTTTTTATNAAHSATKYNVSQRNKTLHHNSTYMITKMATSSRSYSTVLPCHPFSPSLRRLPRRSHMHPYHLPTTLCCCSTVSIQNDNRDDIISQIPLEDVRNFCFIAHVDHGKSSLSSRVLELTGNLGNVEQMNALQFTMTNTNTTVRTSTTSGENHTSSSIDTYHDNDSDLVSEVATSTSSSTSSSSNSNNNKERINLLDTLAVEQQRGITVKASTATMLYPHPSAIGPTKTLLLNMYDTPGHVDFGREVSRSLSFVQGAVLLLDATQGIQAQTWSVYDKVMAIQPQPPKLIIALTKVDLPNARPDHVALTVADWLQYDDPDAILYTSARNRIGIKPILDAVCEQIPSPTPLSDDTDINYHNEAERDAKSILRAQVVDSWYDSRGVNCLIQIVAGQLKENDRISIITSNGSGSNSSNNEATTQQQQQQSYSVQEVGIMIPHPIRTKILLRGQMGYVRFGLRDPRQAMPGTLLIPHAYATSRAKRDSIQLPTVPVDAMSSKSVLYASVHPTDSNSFEELCNAVERLALNDTGLEVTKTSSVGDGESQSKGGPFLGPGLRVGFQGLLHVEVFRQRLQDEFKIDAVVTPPKVPYRITWVANSKKNNLKEDVTKIVEDLSEWPEAGTKYHVVEPVVDCRIIARVEDAGAVMELMRRKRGTELMKKPIDEEKWLFTARIPWAEVVTDLHDQLKNVTAGYGSLDTQKADPPWAEASLSKVDIMLNNESVAPLAFVCHRDMAHTEAKAVCRKLREVLPRQQFVTVIQAKADGKIIASERIQAYRKDVLTKSGKTVGGGDQTRKMKLLEKQKKGKERMQQTGRVSLSQEAFNSVISRSS